MNDEVYELAKKLIEVAQEKSKNKDAISYAYLAGIYQGVLQCLPNTKENIAYLKTEIQLTEI